MRRSCASNSNWSPTRPSRNSSGHFARARRAARAAPGPPPPARGAEPRAGGRARRVTMLAAASVVVASVGALLYEARDVSGGTRRPRTETLVVAPFHIVGGNPQL